MLLLNHQGNQPYFWDLVVGVPTLGNQAALAEVCLLCGQGVHSWQAEGTVVLEHCDGTHFAVVRV